MSELRGALIILAVLFLAALALWEWRRSRGRHAGTQRTESATIIEPRPEQMERARRVEPGLEGFSVPAADPCDALDVPTIHPAESMRVGVASESAVDIPAAARFEMHVEPRHEPARPAMPAPEVDVLLEPVRRAEAGSAAGGARDEAVPVAADVERPAAELPAIKWPPQSADRVLTLRLVGVRGEALQGRALRIALESAGLLHGPQMIYHRIAADGAVLVSVANMMRPGNFDPATMDAQEFRGLSLFSVLPGALPPAGMLEELVALARGLAHRLAATVQNDQGTELDAEALAALRQSLPAEAGMSGDGTIP